MTESVSRLRDAVARAPNALVPVVFLLVAACLRSWHLDHMSIWQDEGLSFYRATQGLAELLSGHIPLGDLITRDTHPPFYFLLLAGWFRLVGVGMWTAKWLSMLVGLPAVALIWALAKRSLGARAAAIAAALASVAPVYLWYSQEVRSYTLTVTLGVAAVYSLRRAIDDQESARARVVWGVGMVVAAAVLLWTHFLGFFVAAFIALAVVLYAVRLSGRRAMYALAAIALVALAAVPLLPYAVWRLGLGAERDQHFVPLQVMLLDIVRGFGVGRTFAGSPSGLLGDLPGTLGIAGWVLAGLYAVLVVVGAMAAWRRSTHDALMLTGYLLVPVLGLFVMTLVKPVYLGPQHILLVSPAFFVLVAGGLTAALKWRPVVGQLTIAVVLLAALWADLNFYADPAMAKDDLRGLAAYVDERAVPGDVLAVSDPVLERSFEHMVSRVPVVAVPRMLENGLLDDRPPADQLGSLIADHGRVWFMTPLDEHKTWLDVHALLVDREGFHGASIPVRVDAYERPPNVEEGTMPPRSVGGNDPLLGGLMLRGWEVVPGTLVAGEGARVRLMWQVFGDDLPDYKVSLRLLDQLGRDYAVGDHEPYHGEFATSRWPTGELVYEPHDLLVDPWAPPGEYRLAVSVYDPETGEVFPAEGSMAIGAVNVARQDQSFDRFDVEAEHRLNVSGPGVRVLGYDLPDGPRAPGEEMPVDVWLQLDGPSFADWLVEVVDGLGRVVARSDYASPSQFEGSRDDSSEVPEGFIVDGDLRRISYDVPLPAEGGRYRLRLRSEVPDRWGDEPHGVWLRDGLLPVRAVWLGDVVVDELERLHEVPIMDRQVQLDVGDYVALMGYDLPDDVVSGQTADVGLYWRARADVPLGYHVTVQLVPTLNGSDPAGPPAAQHDGVPANGARPMTGWTPGEIVTDRHQLVVPPDLEGGRYMLIAALYDPAAPEQPRPSLVQNGASRDYVLLDVVDVKSADELNSRTP